MRDSVEPAAIRNRREGIWPKAVLFDLDGTLVDTAPDIAVAVNRMLVDMGRTGYPLERILQWVGNGAPRLVKRALTGSLEADPPAAEFERGHALFLEHYAAGICEQSTPYPHARRLLADLRACGIRTGCVTNKPERLSRLLFDALSLSSLLDVLVGGDSLGVKKPDPEPLRHACRQLDVEVADTVYVGDSLTDCEATVAAGMTMVAVTYGYHRGADLTQAPNAAIIDSLDALPETLKQI